MMASAPPISSAITSGSKLPGTPAEAMKACVPAYCEILPKPETRKIAEIRMRPVRSESFSRLFIALLRCVWLRGSGGVGDVGRRQTRDGFVSLGDRGLLRLFAERETFCEHELDVGDAEEREELANIGRFMVAGAGVHAAARRDHIRLLVRQQADRPLLRVLEGDAGAGDVIEVGLQRRRDVEVVHRRSEDDDVGALELFDERVGLRDDLPLRVRALFGLGEERREALGSQVRQWLAREVAIEDRGAVMLRAPVGDEMVGELAGLAAVAVKAAVQLQERRNCFHGRVTPVEFG